MPKTLIKIGFADDLHEDPPPKPAQTSIFFLAFPRPGTMNFGVSRPKYKGRLDKRWKEYISRDDDLDPGGVFFQKKE